MGGIAPAELAAVRGRLEAFADDLFESLPRTDQRARGSPSVHGRRQGKRMHIATAIPKDGRLSLCADRADAACMGTHTDQERWPARWHMRHER